MSEIILSEIKITIKDPLVSLKMLKKYNEVMKTLSE